MTIVMTSGAKVPVAPAEGRSARDAAYPAKPFATGLCGASALFGLADLGQPDRACTYQAGVSRKGSVAPAQCCSEVPWYAFEPVDPHPGLTSVHHSRRCFR